MVIGVPVSQRRSEWETQDIPARASSREIADLAIPATAPEVESFDGGPGTTSESEPAVPMQVIPSAEEVVKTSTRKLRGILKKPKRISRDGHVTQNRETANSGEHIDSRVYEGVIPEISTEHSDEDKSPGHHDTADTVDSHSPSAQRSSLQITAFDRLLFAQRGAILREEYMRELAAKE